jgi:bifunctional non-homologous end joining protein LigD
VDAIDYPDRMIFDLDPAPEVSFEVLKMAAQDLKQRLALKGLDSRLKCTGGKGLHVTVPLAGKDKWCAVKSFAGSLANEMVAGAPDAYIATMSISVIACMPAFLARGAGYKREPRGNGPPLERSAKC